MVLDASLLNTQHYKVRIKGKVEQSREVVAPSPTHWCSSYRKGSLCSTIYIYIYIHNSINTNILLFLANYFSLFPSKNFYLSILVPFVKSLP